MVGYVKTTKARNSLVKNKKYSIVSK